MATTDQERNGQIIQYLCSIQAYVVSCCCEYPAGTTNGQNPEEPIVAGSLLTNLALAYPTTVWTDAALLVRLLTTGAKRGLYKRNVEGANTFWFINLNLIKATPANKVYMPYCSAIKDCPFGFEGHPIV
jgi:hypothetical protein